MAIYLYFITCIFFFIYIKQRSSRFNLAMLLVSVYTLTSFFSILEYHFYPLRSWDVKIDAMVYFIICVFISLLPFTLLGKNDCRHFIIPVKLVNYISLFLLFWGLIELYYSCIDLYDNRFLLLGDMSEIRAQYISEYMELNVSYGFLEGWSYVFHYLQFMSPFCCLYYLVTGNKKMAILMFLASLSFPVHNMTKGEREAIIIFLSNYAFCYVYFAPMIRQTLKDKLKRIGLILLSPFILFLIGMSISRFEDSDVGILGSLFAYSADQPFLFSYIYSDIDINNQMLGGRMNFRYLFPPEQQQFGQINNYIKSDVYLNAFAGMPGSFMFDFGYFTILVVALFSIMYYFIIRTTKKNKGLYPFHLFFLLYFSYQVLFMNIFYFDFDGKIKVLLPTLLFIICYIYPKFSLKHIK